MNPMKLLQFKSSWERFIYNHPKFPLFLSAVHQNGIAEGTKVEFRITTPDGEQKSAILNLKLDDIALFEELEKLMK